jgi:hypothetical protein
MTGCTLLGLIPLLALNLHLGNLERLKQSTQNGTVQQPMTVPRQERKGRNTRTLAFATKKGRIIVPYVSESCYLMLSRFRHRRQNTVTKTDPNINIVNIQPPSDTLRASSLLSVH